MLFFEAEIIEGLAPFALAELRQALPYLAQLPCEDAAAIRFTYKGVRAPLHQLRTVMGVYQGQQYPITHPRALLTKPHWQTLLKQIESIRRQHRRGTFKSFRISAAGHQSKVFQRLKTAIAKESGLAVQEGEADLLLRVRPAQTTATGWELLGRVTPRPLSARAWRVANMEGALNATTAVAMIHLTHPQPTDCVLNLMCGSGTLLVECLLTEQPALVVGSDIVRAHLRYARMNLAATAKTAVLLHQNDQHLPFADHTFDLLLADPPWAQLIGVQSEVEALYPAVLAEAFRVAKPKARFAFITHQIRLMEQTLAAQRQWQVERVIKLAHHNTRPRIYLLRRRGSH